jgi:hypothetical protein
MAEEVSEPTTDEQPDIVDTAPEPVAPPAPDPAKLSSTPRTDPEPALVEGVTNPRPTAGELRADGVEVPDDVRDDEVPTGTIRVDTPRAAEAAPALVEDYQPPIDPRTPNERLAEQRPEDAGKEEKQPAGE